MKNLLKKATKIARRERPHEGNTTASKDFAQTVALVLEQSRHPIRIAEIGVDKGASTKEVLKLLREGDAFDLFDRENCDLFKNPASVLADCKAQVSIHSNSNRLFDSYAWVLAKQLTQLLREGKSTEIWDVVYLDGAHTFPVDAPATCCIKEMVKVGGYIVFDDMNWAYGASPTVSKREEILERFTDEQNAEPHVRLVVEAFVRTDTRYEELSDKSATRAVFRRVTK